jgi:hypothetical protein
VSPRHCDDPDRISREDRDLALDSDGEAVSRVPAEKVEKACCRNLAGLVQPTEGVSQRPVGWHGDPRRGQWEWSERRAIRWYGLGEDEAGNDTVNTHLDCAVHPPCAGTGCGALVTSVGLGASGLNL